MREDLPTLRQLRFTDLLRLSLRVFRTRTSRTMMTILGISLGTGVVLFLVSLGYGLQYTLIGRLVTTQDSLITIEAYYPPDSNLLISETELQKIQEIPEQVSVSPVAEFPSEIKIIEETISSSTPPAGYLFSRIVENDYFNLSGVLPDVGRTFSLKDDEIVISSAGLKVIDMGDAIGVFRKKLSLQVIYADEQGNSIVVPSERTVQIVGIVKDDVSPPYIIVPTRLVPKPAPYYQKVLVKAKDTEAIEVLRDKLINMGFLVSTHIDLVMQAQKVMNIITIILGVFGVTALLVSAIGMFNTMVISFLERTFEVGIMKAIGATNRDIRNLFLTESLIMGLCGGIGGILIGTFLGETANWGLNFLARSFGGKEISLFIRPIWFQVSIIAFSGFIGIMSGFFPARRATNVSPKEAFIRK